MFAKNSSMSQKSMKSGQSKLKKTKTNDLQCKNCTLASALESQIRQFKALNGHKSSQIFVELLTLKEEQKN